MENWELEAILVSRPALGKLEPVCGY
jgi:hypothetical protein